MFTQRKMFSISFVASAVAALETGTVLQITAPYSAHAAFRLASSMPPTTFGIVAVLKSLLFGSSRSGENADMKSFPAFKQLFDSNIGQSTSSVVPGYVVDSKLYS